MSVELTCHGAVGTVTGSCHLLKAGGLNLLVDCGLFQGENQWRAKNLEDFHFDPASIDYLLLSHGHLDHCGRIPLLVKNGFRGKVLCTSATYDIAKVVIMDTAHIQMEDFDHWKKINLRDGFTPKKPLYTMLDALDSIAYFRPVMSYGVERKLNDKVSVTFGDAGHIIGASFIEVDVKGEGRVVFSGDLGNRNKPIIRDPQFARDADAIVIESTYANREHRGVQESIEELLGVIENTFERGGNVLIPAFAVARTQELLYSLRVLYEYGRLPKCSIYLDSPMGINVTNIMRKHPECLDYETNEILNSARDPFTFPWVQFTKTQNASIGINSVKSNAIIIAGSGMCTGGRIRLHMKHNIYRAESSIVFIGYQATGTLGRELVDGAKSVNFLGETYNVNSSVHTIGGFSSHADRSMLLDWLSPHKSLKHLFLVHGEAETVTGFKSTLEEMGIAQNVQIPEAHKPYSIL